MVYFLATLCLLLAAALVFLMLKGPRERARHAIELQDVRADIERKAENASLERDRILNAFAEAFFLVAANGTVTFANEAARRLFPGRAVLNRSVDELFLEERLAAPVREARSRSCGITQEVILPLQASPLGRGDQRGETAWVVDVAPINLDRPQEGFRVLIRDRTSEYHTEQVRKDFVANASHELRTPLAIINGYIENLLEDEAILKSAHAERFLSIMQRHGDRLARIVEDMLVISRLESGEAAALNIEPFAIAGCIKDVLERLEPVISQQGATVVLTQPDPGLRINGDRFYWTQVLFNLVENALKQNPHPPVTVEIGFDTTPSGGLRIWVSDNGIGIPSVDLPFIFRRFFRVAKHHSQGEIKGTGLGLSIVKRAIEAHDGTIQVTSTPGQETRFEITLPADRVHLPETEPATASV